MDFLSKKEKILEEEFTNQGFIIREAADKNALNKIQKFAIDLLEKENKRGGKPKRKTRKNRNRKPKKSQKKRKSRKNRKSNRKKR